MTEKELIIVSGANGSGKTTFAIPYVNEKGYEFLNTDEVAKRAKEAGFKIKTIYIFLDDAQLCVQRVRTRVLKGGHDVPTEDIIRRFYRSKENFWNEFVKLSDEWLMLYNGEDGFQQVAIGNSETFTVINEILFEKFKIEDNEKGK